MLRQSDDRKIMPKSAEVRETASAAVFNTLSFMREIKCIRDSLTILLGKTPLQYSEQAGRYLHGNIRLNRLECVVGSFYEVTKDKKRPLSLWNLLHDHTLITSENIDELRARLRFVIEPIAGMNPVFSPELKKRVDAALKLIDDLYDHVLIAEKNCDEDASESDNDSEDESYNSMLTSLTFHAMQKEEKNFYRRYFGFFTEPTFAGTEFCMAKKGVAVISEKDTEYGNQSHAMILNPA